MTSPPAHLSEGAAMPFYAGRLGHGLHSPAGLALDGHRLWVADTEASRVVSLDLRGRGQDQVGEGVLREPRDVAVHDGRVFVADSARNCVEVFGRRGRHVATIGRGEVISPRGVAVDAAGRLLVSDVGNNRVALYDPDRGRLLGQITDGVHIPYGIATDATGFWLVNSSRQYDGDCGFVRFEADLPGQSLGDGQHSTFGAMSNPAFPAVDHAGRVLVSVADFGFVQRFTTDGTFVDEFGADGPGLLRQPLGIVTTPDGAVLVADRGNRRIVRFEEAA